MHWTNTLTTSGPLSENKGLRIAAETLARFGERRLQLFQLPRIGRSGFGRAITDALNVFGGETDPVRDRVEVDRRHGLVLCAMRRAIPGARADHSRRVGSG